MYITGTVLGMQIFHLPCGKSLLAKTFLLQKKSKIIRLSLVLVISFIDSSDYRVKLDWCFPNIGHMRRWVLGVLRVQVQELVCQSKVDLENEIGYCKQSKVKKENQ